MHASSSSPSRQIRILNSCEEYIFISSRSVHGLYAPVEIIMTINRSTSFLTTSNHAQTSKLFILSKRKGVFKEIKVVFLSYIWPCWILSLIFDSWPTFLKWAYLNENKQVKRDQLLDQNCFNQIYFKVQEENEEKYDLWLSAKESSWAEI